ncbi:MAG: sugar phosphate isomerase/epimerase, partial [Chloroflexales bacterium]|nr:sugar phosphate isomerase/epimerase [Chloroflexales bacterium]
AIVNAITFFPWADADAAIQAAGLAQATREMALLAELGCVAVAAPPYGNVADTTLDAMASAFARLHTAAQQTGIDVYLEFWGRAPRLSRLSEALYIAVESGVADAKLLLDPFHMYTGGSTLQSTGYLNGANIGIVHVNDYPAQPMRAQIADRDRVFPGEGIAPTHDLARQLHQARYDGYLSLELFMETYGGASALEVAQRGRAAMERAYTLDGV